jgi:hypothetical protein
LFVGLFYLHLLKPASYVWPFRPNHRQWPKLQPGGSYGEKLPLPPQTWYMIWRELQSGTHLWGVRNPQIVALVNFWGASMSCLLACLSPRLHLVSELSLLPTKAYSMWELYTFCSLPSFLRPQLL